ncbi:MAG: polysaccharide biosynthesis/export family protein [Xanthomonadales bacterium]|nr:polysaccharide biosynthesis/export family protein [Xanthomonadales bacterium]
MTPIFAAARTDDRSTDRGDRSRRAWLRACAAVMLFVLCGLLQAQDVFQDQAAGAAGEDSGYALGPRDRIAVEVFNHPDLSGEYELDGDGRFSMPLIGVVDAAGLTSVELKQVLIDRLKPDYLVDPRVSIEVRNYRPYYLIGEVQSTGSFPYVAGITYLTAIAMAGGYTYRAKQDVVYVIRGNDPEQEEIKLNVNEKVRPGDIIRVAERLF